jgi:hypothetical protein
MRVRYVKAHGPYAVGDVREASHEEASQLMAHGVVELEGGHEVRHATEKHPKKRTATVSHDEG